MGTLAVYLLLQYPFPSYAGKRECKQPFLSPLAAEIAVGNPENPAVFNVRQIESLPVGTSEIATATCKDPVLSKVLVCMIRGWPERVQDALRLYWLRRNELTVEQDTLL